MLQVRMSSDELPAIAVEPEFLEELQRVLLPGESIEAFMTQALLEAVRLRLRLHEDHGRAGKDGEPEGGS